MARLLATSLLAAAVGTASAAGSADLNTLQWHYRIIAVFVTDTQAAQQAEDRLAAASGIDDRDIAWFVVTPDAVQTNLDIAISHASLATLHEADGFEAVLVGKDGTVKRRQTDTLDLPAFFDAIDAMPMRQREMHDR